VPALFKLLLPNTQNSSRKTTKENINTSPTFSNMPPKSQQPRLTLTTSPIPDLVELEIEGLTHLQDEQLTSRREVLSTQDQPSSLSLMEINEMFTTSFPCATQAQLTRIVEEWRNKQGRITLCETRTVCEADIYLGPMSLPYIPETTLLLGPPAIEEVDTVATEEANVAQIETPPASVATLDSLKCPSEELIQFYYNKIQAEEAQRQEQQLIPVTKDIYRDPVAQMPPHSSATIPGEFYVEFPVV